MVGASAAADLTQNNRCGIGDSPLLDLTFSSFLYLTISPRLVAGEYRAPEPMIAADHLAFGLADSLGNLSHGVSGLDHS